MSTYKFLGGEPKRGAAGETHTLNLLYSAPIQLDEREENNFITFNVFANRTFVRFYVESPTMALSLEQLQTADESHPKQIGTFS